jgi:hypothetical protein
MNSDEGILASLNNGEDYNIKREKVDVIEVEYKDVRVPLTPVGTSYLKCILDSVLTGVVSSRFTKG